MFPIPLITIRHRCYPNRRSQNRRTQECPPKLLQATQLLHPSPSLSRRLPALRPLQPSLQRPTPPALSALRHPIPASSPSTQVSYGFPSGKPSSSTQSLD